MAIGPDPFSSLGLGSQHTIIFIYYDYIRQKENLYLHLKII